MQALRVVMLLLTVAFCYLLFVRSQATNHDAAESVNSPMAHSQYKEAMDRAHDAAKSMEDERKEAYSD